ncbi:MAG: hypothetical protein ACREJC_21225 [Tepidisphaeraceae bacterium]
MTRGLVLGLTPEQVVARARYLASPECVTGYYRLEYPNGGTDPTASDPFARWQKPGSTFVNVTADCIAGALWCQGVDRKQPKRFPLWEGSINCDSMLIDALGSSVCFVVVDRPAPGDMCVYGSVDYDCDGDRDRVGHIMTITDVPAEWDRTVAECWAAIRGVDVAARRGRANMATTGTGWFGVDKHGVPKDSQFIHCVMQP